MPQNPSKLSKLLGLIAALWLALPAVAAQRWVPDHVVIVILENRSYQELVDSPDMPYFHSLAQDGAVLTNFRAGAVPYGITVPGFKHPFPARGSQVNYLYLFSGSNQGFLPQYFSQPGSPYLGTAYQDPYGVPLDKPLEKSPIGWSNEPLPDELRPLTTPNLGAALIAAGKSFACFSEMLPYPHYDAKESRPEPKVDGYARRHNSVISWVNIPGHVVPAERQRFVVPVASNLAFDATIDPVDHQHYRGFDTDADGRPIGYDQLPTVSIVVPANIHNIHTGGKAEADDWMQTHIKPYANWARKHNSLLIVTTDEDGATDLSNGLGPYDQQIATIRKEYFTKMGLPDTAAHGGAYQYGRDHIPVIVYGPKDRVVAGVHGEEAGFNNMLATVLDFYGLLDDFRHDFAVAQLSQSDPKRVEEARHQLDDLQPMVGLFKGR